MHIKELADDRSAAGLPDLADVVLARDADAVAANAQLHRVVARQYLIRVLRTIRRLTEEQPEAPVLPALRRHLEEVDVETALRWAVRPETTGWIWRVEAGGAGLPALLADTSLLAPVDPAPAPATVALLSDGPPAPVLTRHGSAAEARLLEWSAEGDEDPLDLDPTAAREFAGALQEAVDLLARCWPEATELVGTDISAFAALGNHRGLRALNFSIHGLRGLVLTSTRPAYMLAQTLVHEATHQRFSGVLDCVAVVRNPQATHFSPFVEAERPMGHVLHGILSFINDVYAAQRWSALETDPVELDRLVRYRRERTDRLRLAMKNLLEVAQPTSYGAQLIDGCQAAMAELSHD